MYGFVRARPPAFSPLTHPQISSRERRLVAIFNKLTMPADRFRETARQLECDEDKERFEEKLGRLAKAKPAPKPKTER
jgi:hypothetical protein